MLLTELLKALLSLIFFAGVLMPGDVIKLPEPRLKGDMSLEETISKRRSIRSFGSKAMSLDQLSQLLWAAQGITDKQHGFRSAPSAGATYPMELYVFVKNVKGIPAGLYRYVVEKHALQQVEKGDFSGVLSECALGQYSVKSAAINFLISAVFERTTQRYGKRGIMYVHMEAGHIAQNLHLQAVALGLGSAPVGAFHPDKVEEEFDITGEPLYIIPVGYPK